MNVTLAPEVVVSTVLTDTEPTPVSVMPAIAVPNASLKLAACAQRGQKSPGQGVETLALSLGVGLLVVGVGQGLGLGLGLGPESGLGLKICSAKN